MNTQSNDSLLALLQLGAELLLINGPQCEVPSLLSSSSSSKMEASSKEEPHPQPHPLPKGTSLFGNTSFELGTRNEDMEIENTEVQENSSELVAEKRHKSSLYDYLSDMFGERLSLRLSTRQLFSPALNHTPSDAATKWTTMHDHPKETQYTNQSLINFLSREGFKPHAYLQVYLL